jgi:hypothetical protein
VRKAILAMAIAVVAARGGAAENPPLPPEKPRATVVQLHRQQSLSFPVVVLGPDIQENAYWLEAVEKAHRELPKLLGERLPPQARFEYVWLSGEKRRAGVDFFPRQLRISGETLTWVVEARGELPRDRDALWRSSFLCQIQAFVLARLKPRAFSGELADPPFWVMEGMTQMLSPARGEAWGKIVERYSRTDKRPSLQAVQAWEELGDDSLERIYRSVFCHRLLVEATASEAERRALAAWLKSLPLDKHSGPFLYWAGNSTQESWWRMQTGRPIKQPLPLYTWEESATRLREAMHFSLKMKGQAEASLVTLSSMPEKPEDVEDLQPVRDAAVRLLQAETQAHPVWRPILLKYRSALELWLGGKRGAYQEAVAEAARMQERAGQFMEDVRDYLDWVTVNYPTDQPDASYGTYSALVRLLEQEKPDLPAKANGP